MDFTDLIDQTQPAFMANLRNSIYFDVLGDTTVKEAEMVRINPTLRNRGVVRRTAITRQLGPATVTTRHGQTLINWRQYAAYMVYRPDVPKVYFVEDGSNYINTYLPPKFLEDVYWQPGMLLPKYELEQKVGPNYDELPKAIVDFLVHLTDNDFDSLEYLMQWLATALTPGSRNITTLVLISKPGVGKGVFYDSVIVPLFGESNTRLVRGEDTLGGRFNNALHERQFVLFDESKLTDESQINRFKLLANSSLEIEQKGKDTFNSKNWLNTMITSNNLDSIRIDEDDRRYSVLQTANATLEQMVAANGYGTVTELKRQLEDPENVKAFYDWLRTFAVERNMNIPFKATAKTAEIKDAGFAEWEHGVITYLNKQFEAGVADTTVSDLQDYMTDNNIGGKYRVGRTKLEALVKKTEGAYKMLFDSKSRARFVRVNAFFVLENALEVAQMEPKPPTGTRSKLGVVK